MPEGGPNIEGLEQPEQPDLLSAFADREVTIFGMTGTFQYLSGMCPVDLSDSSITLEDKNEFVVKVANEAGLEIEPQHKEVFDRIIEKHGLEQKFTVAEPAKNPAAENTPAVPVNRPERKPEIDASPVAAQATRPASRSTPAARTMHEELIEQQRRAVREAYTATDQKDKDEVPKPKIAPAKRRTAPAAVKIENAGAESGDAPAPDNIIHIRQAKPATKEPVAISTGQTVVEQAVSAVDAPAALPILPEEVSALVFSAEEDLFTDRTVTEQSVSVVDAPAAPLPSSETVIYPVFGYELDTPADQTARAVGDLPIVPSLEGVVEGLAVPEEELTAEELFRSLLNFDEAPERPAVDWSAELDKEPEQVYEDFVGALNAFVELAAMPIENDGDNDEETLIADQIGDHENPERQPAPPIVLTVAGRLAELGNSEKEAVAPILQNITGAIHGIGLLQAREAEPEMIAETVAQLEELCIVLFEALGIDYEDEDIKQFVGVMIRPEFKPVQPPPQELRPDLEYTGTREAKWHFPKLPSGIAGLVEERIQRAVGMLALTRLPSPAIIVSASN